MTLTAKHFKEIARIIADARKDAELGVSALTCLAYVEYRFEEYLNRENPRFDIERFRKAARDRTHPDDSNIGTKVHIPDEGEVW